MTLITKFTEEAWPSTSRENIFEHYSTLMSLWDPAIPKKACQINRTPRVQGGGDAATGLPGGTAKHHEKVAGNEVRRGGALIWWKNWCDGGGDASWGGATAIYWRCVRWGGQNGGKGAPLANRVGPQHEAPPARVHVGFPLGAADETLRRADQNLDLGGEIFYAGAPHAAFGGRGLYGANGDALGTNFIRSLY
jgi:hypothetical protein